MKGAPRARMSRETRLLVVTITVSALVLLLLSRLRFPESSPTLAPSPAPIERLAARATYDELAAIVAGLERRVAPGLAVLRLASDAGAPPRMLGDVLVTQSDDEVFRHVPALRLDAARAVAVIPADARLAGIVAPSEGPAESLRARDHIRRLGLVNLPAAGDQAEPLTLGALQPPTYVVVVEGTRAGLTFRPLFVGSGDRFTDPRWEHPLIAVSSVALATEGALVFSLEGQFIGAMVVAAGTLAIADAAEVVSAAEQMSVHHSPDPFDAGIAVQPLTTALAAALGTHRGVVVSGVSEQSPARGVLEPADVVVAVDGHAIDTTEQFLIHLARRRQATIALAIVRERQPQDLAITLAGPQGLDRTAGVTLQVRRGGGSLVSAVRPGGAADRAGIRPGDLIARVGGVRVPTPAQFTAEVENGGGRFVAVTVEREGRTRVLALERAEPVR